MCYTACSALVKVFAAVYTPRSQRVNKPKRYEKPGKRKNTSMRMYLGTSIYYSILHNIIILGVWTFVWFNF